MIWDEFRESGKEFRACQGFTCQLLDPRALFWSLPKCLVSDKSGSLSSIRW